MQQRLIHGKRQPRFSIGIWRRERAQAKRVVQVSRMHLHMHGLRSRACSEPRHSCAAVMPPHLLKCAVARSVLQASCSVRVV